MVRWGDQVVGVGIFPSGGTSQARGIRVVTERMKDVLGREQSPRAS